LLHQAKGIAALAYRASLAGGKDPGIDRFVVEALFTTVTNVNFDAERLMGWIREGEKQRRRAVELYRSVVGSDAPVPEIAKWAPAENLGSLLAQQAGIGIEARKAEYGGNIAGLQELLLYGLKGAAAYAEHARILELEDGAVNAFFHEALAFLGKNPTDIGVLTEMSLRCGEINLQVMELLDRAHTSSYGAPVPTSVRVEPRAGKAILISGHDLKDLEELLKQTEGTGINVYTHGDMLPAHGYPGLHRYATLAGNYGGAWQDQQKEFDDFPGAILMTTNCIQKPLDSYRKRIFTAGLVAWPGVTHVEDRDFTQVIEAAKPSPGFAEEGPERTILVGFARDAVLGIADKVIDVVKTGAIRHLFLVGGCDGARPGRNYYTDLASRCRMTV